MRQVRLGEVRYCPSISPCRSLTAHGAFKSGHPIGCHRQRALTTRTRKPKIQRLKPQIVRICFTGILRIGHQLSKCHQGPWLCLSIPPSSAAGILLSHLLSQEPGYVVVPRTPSVGKAKRRKDGVSYLRSYCQESKGALKCPLPDFSCIVCQNVVLWSLGL